jgi:hypothetical protein
MVTHEIVEHVAPGRAYRIGEPGIVDAPLNSSANSPAEAPPTVDAAAQGSTFPPHLRLSGEWDSSVAVETEQANIFSVIGTLTLGSADIVIPVAPVTCEMLGFYGARLLIAGKPFAFDTLVDLPIIHMEVGASYTTGFLEVASKGGESFLEHYDRPHLHITLDEEGWRITDARPLGQFERWCGLPGLRLPGFVWQRALHAVRRAARRSVSDRQLPSCLRPYRIFLNAVLRAPGGGMVSARFAALA